MSPELIVRLLQAEVDRYAADRTRGSLRDAIHINRLHQILGMTNGVF